MSIEWTDPAPSHSGNRTLFTDEVLAALRGRPNVWACVIRGHKSASVAGQFAKKHPEFEVATRRANGAYDIYARFVGADR